MEVLLLHNPELNVTSDALDAKDHSLYFWTEQKRVTSKGELLGYT